MPINSNRIHIIEKFRSAGYGSVEVVIKNPTVDYTYHISYCDSSTGYYSVVTAEIRKNLIIEEIERTVVYKVLGKDLLREILKDLN